MSYSNLGCGAGEFTCNNGQCIHIELQCDEKQNCQDGSDEINCGWSQNANVNLWYEECNGNELSCNNGKCLPMTFRCNGRKECFDGSDEIDCGWF